jgi:PAS domain S-box-containing protein
MARARSTKSAARPALATRLEHAPLAFVVTDIETGKILHVSEQYFALMGRTRKALVGLDERELALYERLGGRDAMLDALATTGATSHELTIDRAAGEPRILHASVNALVLDGRRVLLTTLEDVTARRASDRRLRESEERFRAAFDAAATGMALVGRDGRWLKVNESLCRIVGYAEDELLRMTFQEITHPDDIDIDLANVEQMLSGALEYYELEKRYLHKSGRVVWVLLSVSFARDGDGETHYFVSQVQDITDRKRAEDALRASEHALQVELAARQERERRFRAIFDYAFQYTGLLSPDGVVLEVNQTALTFGGVTRDAVVGRPLCDVSWWAGDDRPRMMAAVARAAMGELVRYELDLVGADGRTTTVDFSLKPLHDAEGGVAMLIAEGRDVTDFKRAEQWLERTLEEKEILLKEIHHRVKNNMQVVSSLLQLQSRYTRDPEALAMFKESQDRIRSMALIHEKLYKTKDLSRVDFADYLHTLGEMMSRSYGGTRAGVRIVIDADPAWLGVDTAIPLGLILNELVTNAMKHAFSETSGGQISIRFRDETAGRYALVVEDDGQGLPDSFSLESDTSLGLRLLRILTGQVEGSLAFTTNEAGTRFALGFTDNSNEGASR